MIIPRKQTTYYTLSSSQQIEKATLTNSQQIEKATLNKLCDPLSNSQQIETATLTNSPQIKKSNSQQIVLSSQQLNTLKKQYACCAFFPHRLQKRCWYPKRAKPELSELEASDTLCCGHTLEVRQKHSGSLSCHTHEKRLSKLTYTRKVYRSQLTDART